MEKNDKKIVISLNDVTKDYGQSRGNFDLNINIYEGETLGLVGENGAGKTTLLRQIMGFIKSDKGNIRIYNYDAYKDAAETKNFIGYVPGEINFPDLKSGTEFLRQFASQNNIKEKDFANANSYIKRLQLDITAYPRRMSKGMKQKTALVTSLMKNSPIILLDEPTTGLDPLMRDEVLKIILEEKAKNKTIIMSSNTIEELEKVADKVALISKGRIVEVVDVNKIKNRPLRDYKIEFNKKEEFESFKKNYSKNCIKIKNNDHQLVIRINKKDVNELFLKLKGKDIKFITQLPYTLQTYFDESRKNIKEGN